MRQKTSIIWKLNKDTLQDMINKVNSYQEILESLNFCTTGGMYRTLKKRIELDNIDCSHFKLHKKRDYIKKFSNEEVFINGSSYNRGNLKSRIIKQSLIPYKCEICGLEHSWNEQELVLVLDHKNGINNDNRLENLRFLCPNCNSQQSTFAGRNTKKYKKINCCIDCGKVINNSSTRCTNCHNTNQGKNIPTKEQLLKDITTMPIIHIGLKYNVSDNAVRKWCKKYSLPFKKSEIKNLPT